MAGRSLPLLGRWSPWRRLAAAIFLPWALGSSSHAATSATGPVAFPPVQNATSLWRTPGAAVRLAFRARVDAARDSPASPPAAHFVYRFGHPSVPPATAPAVRLELGGLDANGYDRLRIRLRGDQRLGFRPEVRVRISRRAPEWPEGEAAASVTLTDVGAEWREFEIPREAFSGLSDWGHLDALGVALTREPAMGGSGGYFLGTVSFAKAAAGAPKPTDPVVAKRRRQWEQSVGGEVAARAALRARMQALPARVLVPVGDLPGDDGGFLRRLAADTWRGMEGLTDRESGLPVDRVELRADSVAEAQVGDYTSPTNIGLYLMSIRSAQALGLIDRNGALERAKRTLAGLEKLERHRGWFFNYYNTTTGERITDFVSSVDSSWLHAGLMVIRQAFPELAARCGALLDGGDFRFFYDPELGLISHGDHADWGLRSKYHYGMLYTEARLGSLIAIGRRQAPAEHWFRMSRTLPLADDWQSQVPRQRRVKSAGGFRWTGGYYHWRNHDYVPSWGGSVFEALMPILVLDEIRLAPLSLGRNGQTHTAVQREFALETLGYPVWGLSPSSKPGGNQYAEYGVKDLGSAGYPPGAVSPHAAALALLTEPAQATANLRQLATRFPLYGDFGFYDAVDPRAGTVAYNYLCLNQGMILLALANHLANHVIQNDFAADPAIQASIKLLAIENFLD